MSDDVFDDMSQERQLSGLAQAQFELMAADQTAFIRKNLKELGVEGDLPYAGLRVVPPLNETGLAGGAVAGGGPFLISGPLDRIAYNLPSPELVAQLAAVQASASRVTEAISANTVVLRGDTEVAGWPKSMTPEEGEWPKRDAVPRYTDPIGMKAAEVTPEMLTAASEVLAEHYYGESGYDVRDCVMEEVYRAMHALAPVPLVSDGELAASAANPGAVGREFWKSKCETAVRDRDSAQADADWQRKMRKADQSCMEDALQFAERKREECIVLRAELASSKSHAATLEDSLNRALTELTDALADAADLRKQLLAFTSANVDPVSDSPIANAIKVRKHEPWRMGPEGV